MIHSFSNITFHSFSLKDSDSVGIKIFVVYILLSKANKVIKYKKLAWNVNKVIKIDLHKNLIITIYIMK